MTTTTPNVVDPKVDIDFEDVHCLNIVLLCCCIRYLIKEYFGVLKSLFNRYRGSFDCLSI